MTIWNILLMAPRCGYVVRNLLTLEHFFQTLYISKDLFQSKLISYNVTEGVTCTDHWEGHRGCALGNDWDDGDPRVTADHWAVDLAHIKTLQTQHKHGL